MADKATQRFQVYIPTATSPAIFGEVIAIVGVARDGSRYFGDVNVLVERPKRRLLVTAFTVDSTAVPAINVDMNFAISVGRDNARARIAELLMEKFEDGKNWQVFATPFVFQEVEQEHLARLWMLDKWRKQLFQITDRTECPALKDYLGQLKSLPFIKFTETKSIE